MNKLHRYILFNKPFGVLCQFTDVRGRTTLSSFGPFPAEVYPVGRLDLDSEGLVLLTNDGPLKHLLLEPRFQHPRSYMVQVEGVPTPAAIALLRGGVPVTARRTLPASVELLSEDPDVPPRSVPIRFRKQIPARWLKVTLFEGRNRQIRKMTAAVGYPTLRLVRIGIGDLTLEGLNPGDHRDLSEGEIRALKKHAGGVARDRKT